MPSLPSHIFGIHDPGGESIILGAGKRGWVVVTVKVSPPDHDGNFLPLANAGLGVIVRLNHGYGSEGTIPASPEYDAFARRCAAFVAASRGASIWIIGNETNYAGERPGNSGGSGGEVITPELYARCFAKCRAAIRALPGRASDWLVPAPVAPWNNLTTYPANPSGDWVKYFQDILMQCTQQGAPPDAIGLHTYTHGSDPQLVTSEQKMDAPFQNRRYHFRAYRDFLAAVPSALRARPVLITETQPADPDWWRDQNVGWIQAAFAEINGWNAVSTNQTIQALCLFRWQTGERLWSISDKPALHADLRAALPYDYRVRLPKKPAPAAEAALAAAKKIKWMPVDTSAALFKFAQSAHLGHPQTEELQITVNGSRYTVQVFNLGIVYVKKGDPKTIKWLPKA